MAVPTAAALVEVERSKDSWRLLWELVDVVACVTPAGGGVGNGIHVLHLCCVMYVL